MKKNSRVAKAVEIKVGKEMNIMEVTSGRAKEDERRASRGRRRGEEASKTIANTRPTG